MESRVMVMRLASLKRGPLTPAPGRVGCGVTAALPVDVLAVGATTVLGGDLVAAEARS